MPTCTRAHTEGDMQRQKVISLRNEKEAIIITATNIKRIMGEYQKHFHDKILTIWMKWPSSDDRNKSTTYQVNSWITGLVHIDRCIPHCKDYSNG